MNEYEARPDDSGLLDLAEEILGSEEPDLRRFPMLRNRFGAFEELDEALGASGGEMPHQQDPDPWREPWGGACPFLLQRGREVAGVS
ncbi:hypothetical protein ACIQRS_14160 [Streptomyces termitum]|nr:hypothetical protein [Streptomyces termitum]